MSAYGGLGPMTNGVLWGEVVIFAIFVGLRLYTRRVILNSVGADDYLAILALVSNNPNARLLIRRANKIGRAHV